MLYALHELGYQAAMPSRLAAAAARDWLNWPGNPIGQTTGGGRPPLAPSCLATSPAATPSPSGA
jgi:poly-beta-hydroxyalkanoate depolymerase